MENTPQDSPASKEEKRVPRPEKQKSAPESKSPTDVPHYDTVLNNTLENRLFRESQAMAEYALNHGLKIPSKVVNILGDYENQIEAGSLVSNFETLNYSHSTLVDIVAPVTPGTCVLFKKENDSGNFFRIFGPVPTMRRMGLVAIISLFCMLITSLSDDVNSANLAQGILANNGWDLGINLAFLLSAASLGASFSLLFKVNKDLSNGHYDERNDSSYWANWIMGLVAGLILSEVLSTSFHSIDPAKGKAAVKIAESGTQMTKLILAIVGGFASSVVYNMLNSVVEGLGAAFKKDNTKEIKTEAKRVSTDLNYKLGREKMQVASKLIKLSKTVNKGASLETVDQELDEILKSLVPEEGIDSPNLMNNQADDL